MSLRNPVNRTNEYFHPTDAPYKALVWNCCGIRSLPAYDVLERFQPSRAGLLDAWRGILVQGGAVNMTVAARWNLTPLVDPQVPAGVLEPDGEEVAHAESAAGEARLHVPFETTGIYRLRVNGTGLPPDDIRAEIRIEDGVQTEPGTLVPTYEGEYEFPTGPPRDVFD